ncbi:hypothetical protein LOZ58_001373 [Ophidiomyces ophidiicola]|nr:hypothetical protein LOZ58_001373 [Ophidiomyces ophidiicola]
MHGLLLAAGLLSLPFHAAAHPQQPATGVARRGVDLNAYRLPLKADYKNTEKVEAEPPALNLFGPASYVEVAQALAKTTVPGATFRVVDDHYVGDNGVAHVHLRQTMNGIDIDNADFNVNVKDGKVFSFGNSFYTGKAPSPLVKRDRADPVQALKEACKTLQIPVKTEKASAQAVKGSESVVFKGTSGALSEPKAKLVYLVKSDGNLALTWRVETDIGDNWLLSYVDAKDGKKVHNVVDYVSEATYSVFPWGTNDPTEGERKVFTDPWDTKSSEFTWIGDGQTKYQTTRGNNGIAQSNPRGGNEYLNNYRPMSPALKFEYPYSTSMTPPSSYIDASIAQLFYTSNFYHDLLYSLGFTERAGNFQWNNSNKGGRGNDYVILNAQDGSGTNNANFATPPDGQPGRMRMYTWTTANPNRDGSMEAGIVIHEYTHGLSTRLTGGPANSNCLNALESGGMGEGWGDFMATAIRLKARDTRNTNYGMGDWSANKRGGIRAYVYSTSLSTNPLNYLSVNSLRQVHAIGTVWASMLYEVMWNLIDKHGKNDGPVPQFRNGVPTDGRYLAMKLVVDGMAIQPCNPNFVQARDAILDADRALTGSQNKCEIWKAFAKRQLGVGARYGTTRTGSTEVPAELSLVEKHVPGRHVFGGTPLHIYIASPEDLGDSHPQARVIAGGATKANGFLSTPWEITICSPRIACFFEMNSASERTIAVIGNFPSSSPQNSLFLGEWANCHSATTGGGIIGCSTAYYLTRHPSYDPALHKIVVFEATGIAGGASGKAGGFLAIWAHPDNIAPLSYSLHKELAQEHNGVERWGYRRIKCGQLLAHVTPRDASSSNTETLGSGKNHDKQATSREKRAGSIPADLDWFDPSMCLEFEDMGNMGATAQVHPYLFTTSMMKLAEEKGAKFILGSVTEIELSEDRVRGLKYNDKETGESKSMPVTDAIVAAGPWARTVFSRAPILAERAHSVVIRPTRPVAAYAVFTSITRQRSNRLPQQDTVVSPEIYSRPDGTVYSCGAGDVSVSLPETTADVQVDDSRCQSIIDSVGAISSELRGGEILRQQACYLPAVAGPAAGPLIGPADIKGVHLAVGHTCWGIQNAPATGKLMSEFIFDGAAQSADVASLNPRNFL